MEHVKLRLTSEWDGAGFKAADAAVDKSRDNLGRFTKAAHEARSAMSWGDSLKIGLGDRALSSLAQIPAVIEQGVRSGVMFNATMADSETAIGNVLQKFGGLNREAAKREAGGAMAQIIDLEPKASGGLRDLVQGFMATVASAQAVGMTTEQNIDLVARFSNGLANASIPAEQLSQEMRAIFSGNITPDAAFAKIIGITNEDVERAKAAGNLYDVLRGKIGQLGEAGDTFAVAQSSFNSAIEKMLGLATKPFFDELHGGLKEATELLNNPDLATKIREVATATGQLIDAGQGAAATWKDASAEGFMGMNAASVSQALGWWKQIGAHISGVNVILDVLKDNFAQSRTTEAGNDMSKALGLVGNAERADTPEKQATAKKAIEKEIGEIRGRIARGSLEESGHVKLTVAALEKALAAWEQIAGRSAEMQAATEKSVGPTKEQTKELEKGAAAAERASEAMAAALTARGDAVATPEQRLGRMSERMQGLRDELDRGYRAAGGAGGLEGMDFAGAARQIERGGVSDADRAELLAKLREILALEQAITKEANDQFEKARDQLATEDEKQRKAAEALADLQDELAIQTEITAGHDSAAKLLEIQRNLRKELAQIAQGELAPAEKERAADLARQTAEMQKQKALADEERSKSAAREKAASFSDDKGPAFDPALRGGKGARARKEDRAKYEREFEKVAGDMRQSGMSYTEIDQAREEAMKDYDRKARERRGRFGGSATPSIADRPLGKTGDDAWGALFPKAAPAAGPAAAAPLDYFGAIAAAGVPRTLGEALPQPGGAGPGPLADGGGQGDAAAKAVQGAGDAGIEAKDALVEAADGLKDSLDKLGEAKTEIAAAAEAARTMGTETAAAIAELKTAIEDAKSQIAQSRNG